MPIWSRSTCGITNLDRWCGICTERSELGPTTEHRLRCTILDTGYEFDLMFQNPFDSSLRCLIIDLFDWYCTVLLRTVDVYSVRSTVFGISSSGHLTSKRLNWATPLRSVRNCCPSELFWNGQCVYTYTVQKCEIEPNMKTIHAEPLLGTPIYPRYAALSNHQYRNTDCRQDIMYYDYAGHHLSAGHGNYHGNLRIPICRIASGWTAQNCSWKLSSTFGGMVSQ